ncbi:guanine deaminase [Pleomorphomonas sp. PLEO]|uniref:guanine deaminase n=1 Tax=Pleomorphomonas sp. PLEO TaxID=3239306 RepID=UPI00351E6C25
MKSLTGRAILGTFFQAPSPDRLDVLRDALIEVDEAGTIAAVTLPGDAGYTDRIAVLGEAIVRLPAGSYGIPGFVDCHVHAPQYPQLGQALDVPLEVWLGKYTFPLEARYADLDFARSRYTALIDDLLAIGTTTALYFGTVHLEATKLLADLCIDKGQRALVGKVVMDHPDSCPHYYRDADAATGAAETRALIEYVRSHPRNTAGRVLPVITPRFIPSCTDAALTALGELAGETGAHVQTHCSESDWAHSHVFARYGHTDAEALDRFGLLTRRTMLAHSNFLTDDDMTRVARRGAAVAHCALSNIYFANSVFPLRAALSRHMHVGLGTDISGGPSASMFEACRATVQSSRLLEDGVDPALPAAQRGRPNSRVDLVTAFHVATAGGGTALDLPIGCFAPGFHFDAVAIDTTIRDGGIRLFGDENLEGVFEKLIYGATRVNVAHVWVAGEDRRPT